MAALPTPTTAFFTALGAYSPTVSPACDGTSSAIARAWPSFSVATASLLTNVCSTAAQSGGAGSSPRSHIFTGRQFAYIQDFDVEAFQFEVAADPQINVIHEGVVLDVRPTINHDRKAITLEVQPTVATVVAMDEFTTSLGGSTSPVSFELPELEVKSVFTTVEVPDGGSILLGGLNRIRNVERRAEVPWLGKIPVLGFFFKEEGYADEKQSLMILIEARITDVADALR